MKRFLLLSVAIFFANISFGQFYFHEVEDTARGFYDDFDLELHVYFVNKSDDTAFIWRRYEVSTPSGFLTAVCDNNLCWPPDTSSKPFTLQKNDSFQMLAHFYPENNCGKGSFKVYVYPQSDTNNKVSAEFHTEVWCLGVNDVKRNALKVSPNPANSDLLINMEEPGKYTYRITDMSGHEMLIGESAQPSLKLDVAELKAGVYLIAVAQDGFTYTRMWVKQ